MSTWRQFRIRLKQKRLFLVSALKELAWWIFFFFVHFPLFTASNTLFTVVIYDQILALKWCRKMILMLFQKHLVYQPVRPRPHLFLIRPWLIIFKFVEFLTASNNIKCLVYFLLYKPGAEPSAFCNCVSSDDRARLRMSSSESRTQLSCCIYTSVQAIICFDLTLAAWNRIVG